MRSFSPDASLQLEITRAAENLREDYSRKLWRQTDRLFAVLFVVQWFAAVIMAEWLSPWQWQGLNRSINPHLWSAVAAGGVIASLPVTLALACPGEAITRYVIATAQMLYSSLLIHLSGGRIETHFHVFGSLAFLSFYREWKVLIPATAVVVLDHVLRGMFWPQSVFGVVYASHWRWLEHAGWVVFEDIFLFWSCVRGSRELATLALRQAELEAANQIVEAEVVRQTRKLESVEQELIQTARRAGMAEVATGVLHNVGNVLNSINVSASVLGRKLRESEVASLGMVSEFIRPHLADLGSFLSSDERGRAIGPFLVELSGCLAEEQKLMLAELNSMVQGLDHIKNVVSQQQRHAKEGTVREKVSLVALIDEAIAIHQGAAGDKGVEIVKQIEFTGSVAIDKHRVLQILINLLSNARRAVLASGDPCKRIVVEVREATATAGQRALRFQVSDNGVGIHGDDLTRIFNHGFTTHPDGHGFGLHSAFNAAREMSGDLWVQSDGAGKGSVFTMVIPIVELSEFEQMIDRTRKAA
jgi:signal transduction histidine kinase